MSYSLHQSAVPGFISMLGNMTAWLDKAAAQGDAAKLIEARLVPDMLPLSRQIQIASDAAKGAAARLTGTEPPAMPDTEANFADLIARCEKTIDFLKSIDPAAFDAGAANEVVLTFPNGGGLRCDGAAFLTGFAVPNFYFHAAMTYAVLRAQGIALGKTDYLMHLAPSMFAPPAAAAE